MKTDFLLRSIVLAFLLVAMTPNLFSEEIRRLALKDYRDKMQAGWIGQIAGVCWGAPTEFKYKDRIIPEQEMPTWRPEMINDAFGQDDLYVEMTFLRSLEQYGPDVSQRQAGIDFANSEYRLWCANEAGRNNLRRGIAPPDSGHPRFNRCPNDIDYQIEADFSGLIAPGMPNTAIALGEKFGRLMNYSDGVYGGQFVGGMYCEAFFEDDLLKIIDAGLACIPPESQYAEMVRDVVSWYKARPDDWTATWKACQKKYREDPEYQKCSNGGIDVKINGAYILIGMLYGQKDPDRTIVLSTRCGQDSDCNPSNAAGILFTTFGFSKLPSRFTEKLDRTKKFSYTAYDFPGLIDVCEHLARQMVVREGGRVEKDENGEEWFVIPVKKTLPGKAVQSWSPQPIAGSRFTEEERGQIRFRYYSLDETLAEFFPGWTLTDCGPDMSPGYRTEYHGRKNVLMTHPKAPGEPCRLSQTVELPKNKTAKLRLVVASHVPEEAKFDWELIVRAGGEELLKRRIVGGWHEIVVDLSRFAGKTIKLELLNQPNGWSCEAGYWSEIELVFE